MTQLCKPGPLNMRCDLQPTLYSAVWLQDLHPGFQQQEIQAGLRLSIPPQEHLAAVAHNLRQTVLKSLPVDYAVSV